MVWSEGNMSLKNPVTPPGIDPGTVRLVAQRLNPYATPGPIIIYIGLHNISLWNKAPVCRIQYLAWYMKRMNINSVGSSSENCLCCHASLMPQISCAPLGLKFFFFCNFVTRHVTQ